MAVTTMRESSVARVLTPALGIHRTALVIHRVRKRCTRFSVDWRRLLKEVKRTARTVVRWAVDWLLMRMCGVFIWKRSLERRGCSIMDWQGWRNGKLESTRYGWLACPHYVNNHGSYTFLDWRNLSLYDCSEIGLDQKGQSCSIVNFEVPQFSRSRRRRFQKVWCRVLRLVVLCDMLDIAGSSWSFGCKLTRAWDWGARE